VKRKGDCSEGYYWIRLRRACHRLRLGCHAPNAIAERDLIRARLEGACPPAAVPGPRTSTPATHTLKLFASVIAGSHQHETLHVRIEAHGPAVDLRVRPGRDLLGCAPRRGIGWGLGFRRDRPRRGRRGRLDDNVAHRERSLSRSKGPRRRVMLKVPTIGHVPRMRFVGEPGVIRLHGVREVELIDQGEMVAHRCYSVMVHAPLS